MKTMVKRKTKNSWRSWNNRAGRRASPITCVGVMVTPTNLGDLKKKQKVRCRESLCMTADLETIQTGRYLLSPEGSYAERNLPLNAALPAPASIICTGLITIGVVLTRSALTSCAKLCIVHGLSPNTTASIQN